MISLLNFVKNYYKQSNVSFPVTSQFSDFQVEGTIEWKHVKI